MNASEINKQLATQLANLLYDQATPSSETSALALQLGIQLNAAAAEVAPTATPVTIPAPSGKVGIWDLITENGNAIYSRNLETRMDWWLWAKVHQFPAAPTPGKKRVVLLGESVARGYLYDPFYTVAQELEAQLGLQSSEEMEVIDLARTDLGLPMLQALLPETLQLKPDAIVIFAGNNWLYTMKDSVRIETYQKLSAKLQAGDLKGVKGLLEAAFSQLVQRFLEDAGALSRLSGVPVTFVIPEFNLADWNSNPQEYNITRLMGNKPMHFTALQKSGKAAFAAKDFLQLEDIASQLIELDLTHPLGYEWKAACYLHAGNPEAARPLLEAMRDTALFSRAETKPRCLSIVRETIKKVSATEGIGIVDLPVVFKAAIPGRLPDRELFLDYCHLTIAGIKLSMQAAATQVLSQLKGKAFKPAGITDSGLMPEGDVIAVAHLAAAVHNAHFGQRTPVLLHHCKEAVQAAPLATEFMHNFIDFSTRKLQNTLCITHEKIVESGVFTQYEGGLGFVHARRKKLMDVPLVDAMVAALEGPGGSLAADVLELRIAEHAPTDDHETDLLGSWYANASYDTFNAELAEVNYAQARNNTSSFTFVSDGVSALNASLVCRVPRSMYGSQGIQVFINDKLLLTAAVQEKWQTVTLLIDAAHFLQKGVNELSIHWPEPQQYLKNDPQSVQTPRDFLDFMYPVWGEIFSFELGKEVPVIFAAKQEGKKSERAVFTV